jgi:TPR repeat protein
MKYYKMSSDLGDFEWMNNYLYFYKPGCFAHKDLKEAMKYSKISSDHGNSNGMNNYVFKLS